MELSPRGMVTDGKDIYEWLIRPCHTSNFLIPMQLLTCKPFWKPGDLLLKTIFVRQQNQHNNVVIVIISFVILLMSVFFCPKAVLL